MFRALYKTEFTVLEFYKPILAFVKQTKYISSQLLFLHRENANDEPQLTSVFFVDLLPPFPMADHFQGQVLLKMNRTEKG